MNDTKQQTWKSSLGPRMAKAVNAALSGVSWEAKSFITLSGVVGERESRYVMTSPFSPPRPDADPALQDIGDRYEWTLTPENYKRVIAELDTLRRRLEESRPVHDERRTPEEETARISEHKATEQDRTIEARAYAAERDRIVADLQTKYPWAKQQGSDHARASANIKRELSQAFPGIVFQVRSDSFSGGDSVDVHWIDGPTSAEVDTIIGKYKEGSFDGMQDLYEYDRSAYSAAVHSWLGSAKYVMGHRAMSPATRETLDRLISETFSDPEDKRYPIFSASSIPAGAEIVGLEDTETHPWHRLAVRVPEKSVNTTSARGEIQKHYHTKHGWDFWLVVLTDRVDADTFAALRQRCESAGGWYSRKWGKCPGGFGFKEEQAAQQFLSSI